MRQAADRANGERSGKRGELLRELREKRLKRGGTHASSDIGRSGGACPRCLLRSSVRARDRFPGAAGSARGESLPGGGGRCAGAGKNTGAPLRRSRGGGAPRKAGRSA